MSYSDTAGVDEESLASTGGEEENVLVAFDASAMEDELPILTADHMARRTFEGELEYRQKVIVEINHHLHQETHYVIGLLDTVAADGSSWFQYDQNFWSEWIKKGPEIQCEDRQLLDRKTRIREEMILMALQKALGQYQYRCDVSYPYRNPSDKPFLYITWPRKPKPKEYVKKFLRLLMLLLCFLFGICIVVPSILIGVVGGGHYLWKEFGSFFA